MNAPFLPQVAIRQPSAAPIAPAAPAQHSPEMGIRVRFPFIAPPYVYPVYPAPSLPFYWQNVYPYYSQAYPYYPSYPYHYGWRPFSRTWFW